MRASAILNVGILGTALAVLGGIAFRIDIAAADDTEPRERIVLMTTGRVLTGFASRNAGGWLVEQPNGRVQVPIEQVSVVADNLADAYRKQRDSVAKPTPATHVALAQWCITYRLHDEARSELRECLKLDPDHSAARKLLRRLDDAADATATRPVPTERISRRTSDGFLVPDAESLGGLSTESAASFTQRIQPLLLNKCGNASCHGVTTTGVKPDGFHLISVRAGVNAHRVYTERNLAEVVRQIDLEEPSRSPLVALPQGSHGGISHVFTGTTGDTQLKILREWVRTVAEERIADEAERASRPTIAGRKRRSTTASRDVVTASVPEPVAEAPEVQRQPVQREEPQEMEPKPLAVNGPREPADAKSENPKSDNVSSDPFDPEIFNRRFHAPARPK